MGGRGWAGKKIDGEGPDFRDQGSGSRAEDAPKTSASKQRFLAQNWAIWEAAESVLFPICSLFCDQVRSEPAVVGDWRRQCQGSGISARPHAMGQAIPSTLLRAGFRQGGKAGFGLPGERF